PAVMRCLHRGLPCLVETDALQLPASAREREAPLLHRISRRRRRDVILASWARGFECGREPCLAGEQSAERVELVDSPFSGGGQVGLDERELGETLQGAPASS